MAAKPRIKRISSNAAIAVGDELYVSLPVRVLSISAPNAESHRIEVALLQRDGRVGARAWIDVAASVSLTPERLRVPLAAGLVSDMLDAIAKEF